MRLLRFNGTTVISLLAFLVAGCQSAFDETALTNVPRGATIADVNSKLIGSIRMWFWDSRGAVPIIAYRFNGGGNCLIFCDGKLSRICQWPVAGAVVQHWGKQGDFDLDVQLENEAILLGQPDTTLFPPRIIDANEPDEVNGMLIAMAPIDALGAPVWGPILLIRTAMARSVEDVLPGQTTEEVDRVMGDPIFESRSDLRDDETWRIYQNPRRQDPIFSDQIGVLFREGRSIAAFDVNCN